MISSAFSNSGPGTLKITSIIGNTFHTIYRGPTGMILARAITNTSLLFIQAHIPSGWRTPDEEMLWKVNTDGSQPVKLMVSSAGYSFAFAHDRQLWSIISRDGSLYDIVANGQQSIVIGSLNGGPTKTISTSNGSSDMQPIGWAQL